MSKGKTTSPLDDRISKAGFGKRYKPLEERLKQLENQIPNHRAKGHNHQPVPPSLFL